MITVGLVTGRWTGPGVAGLAEVVDGLTKAIRQAFGAVSFLQPAPVWRNVESRPVMEYCRRRVRIVADQQEAARALRDSRPHQRRRYVVAVAGVSLRNVASLLKGRADQLQRHVCLRSTRPRIKANCAELILTHINALGASGG